MAARIIGTNCPDDRLESWGTAVAWDRDTHGGNCSRAVVLRFHTADDLLHFYLTPDEAFALSDALEQAVDMADKCQVMFGSPRRAGS